MLASMISISICDTKLMPFQCVFQVDRKKGGLTLTELAPGVEVEEVKQKTGAKFEVSDSLSKME